MAAKLLVQEHELARLVESVTVNLRPYIMTIVSELATTNPENAQVLCNYITIELFKGNIADSSMEWKIKIRTWLSTHFDPLERAHCVGEQHVGPQNIAHPMAELIMGKHGLGLPLRCAKTQCSEGQ